MALNLSSTSQICRR